MLATAFVLSANTLLRPVVNRINRQPLDTEAVEATYTFYVIAPKVRQREALTRLEAALEAVAYPTQDLIIHALGSDAVEIEAVLTASALDGHQLDAVVAELSAQDCVTQAFWSPSTTE
ncbi:Protein MgtC [Roseateles saccharophilus]|uniref:MgtC-like C-terminal domain-containing protein n=1 Tax=Roseateles saccharophilus TaxID=304 RepID=A0A4R3UVW7_ROSSA|nr:hypothetical protein EV671_10154 [Roseateles saccharophilus]